MRGGIARGNEEVRGSYCKVECEEVRGRYCKGNERK